MKKLFFPDQRKGFHFFSLFLFLFLFSTVASMAQERFSINGLVKDEDGTPMSGVSVTKKNSQKGVVTDEKGYFVMKTNDTTFILVFSYVGHADQQVKVNSTKQIVVTMQKAVVNQEEIVVIGYGSVRRKDVTGSVATYKPKSSDAVQFGTVDGLLRGRAAGVQIQQNSSAPGGSMSVKIRGTNSLRGDNEPLYVVDGIIISNVTSDAPDPSKQSSNSGSTAQSVLSGINPQDIESIEILKDASATAIYGSRGANGVVIITTKQGSRGKPTVQFSTNWEFAKASKKLNMLDAKGYGSYINEIEAFNGRVPKYNLDTLKPADWQDVLQRYGVTQTHRLSLSGSSADRKTRYYLATGFKNVNGVVKSSGYKQGDLKFNLGQDISAKLKLNFSLSGQYSSFSMTQNSEPLGGGDNSLISKMLSAAPIANAAANVTDPTESFENPYSWLENYDDLANEKRLLSSINLTYKINSAFSYKFNIAGDYRNKERKRWYGKGTFVGKNANGSLGLSQFSREYYLIENLLMWNKTIAKKHRFDATFGVTYDNENIAASNVLNTDFFTEALRTDGFGKGIKMYPYERNRTEVEIFSVLGRVNYSLSSRYILTLSGRADGASKFGPGNKFSYFPAAAFAWKITDEDWFKVKAINDAKLRIGYGRSGNQAISPYNTFAQYGTLGYTSGNTPITGVVPQNIQNQDLKWETTEQYNAGLDMVMFNQRLSLNIDAYKKITYDLLQFQSIPTSAGFAVIATNVGSIENKGIEFTANTKIIDKSDFTWDLGGNIAFNRNKILDLGMPAGQFGINTWEAYLGDKVSTGTYFKDPANIYIVGKPIGLFYGYQTNGVYQTGETTLPGFSAGDVKVIDQDKNGLINESDKVIIGNPNPKFNYGITTNLTYKKFQLGVFFNGVYGSKLVNGNLIRIANPNGVNASNVLADAYYNAWTAVKQTNYPKVGSNNLNFIDRYVEDASFLRLATTTLGYNFDFPKSTFVKQMNVTLTGRNLFVLTKYTGFDPEANSFEFNGKKMGIDWNSYPNVRAITLGVNVTF